jgi:hypothetical protein
VVDFKNMNDHGSLGLRWRVFPKCGSSQTKVYFATQCLGFLVFPAFGVDFKNMNDHGSLGLRWRVFPKIGLIPNKSPLCCAKFGLFCFSGLLK